MKNKNKETAVQLRVGDYIKCIKDTVKFFTKGDKYEIIRTFYNDEYAAEDVEVLDDKNDIHYLTYDYIESNFEI